jgi:ABC-type sulfate transport system permease subunit
VGGTPIVERSSATIWIPLETTVLSKGFEEAFRNGVVQYYENVLAPDAFSAHSVNVIDF